MQSEKQVFLIPISFHRGSESKTLNLKAVSYPDDSMYFDLRRILGFILINRKELRISELLKRELQGWLQFLITVGLDPVSCVPPSKRCAEFHGCIQGDQKINTTFTVSSSALPWLLTHVSTMAWSKDAKCMATLTLRGFLRELLAAEDVTGFWQDVLTIGDDDLALCPVREHHGSQRCTHISEAFTPIEWSTESCHRQLADALSRLYLTSSDCISLSSWLQTVVSGLQQLIDRTNSCRQLSW